ncbi:leucine-rich repeat-containing protein 71 [Rhinophrynus dorsalis]
MVKKTDKTTKDKTMAGTCEDDPKNAAHACQDRESMIEDDYQCTGNLEQDFTELCSRASFTEIPRVVSRGPCRLTTSRSCLRSEGDDSDSSSDKAGQASSRHNSDRFIYFKPSIQVELEEEDAKSVRGIYIRGWKINDKMMGIFSKCLPELTHLHEINLWNVGLTDNTFCSFLEILPHCTNLKTVVVEGNPLPQQSYYKLITDNLPLAHISLRNNQISDDGAKLISQALQNQSTTNRNLVSLILSFNHISDLGASYIAQALRLNRSLLWLSLSNNLIGDEGALALAEILGHFALTHSEVVQRRLLLLERDSQEQPRSPSLSRHTDTKPDRPPSHQSTALNEKTDKAQGASKNNKSVVKKKDKDKETQKKEDKAGANVQTSGTSSLTNPNGHNKKEETKSTKKQISNPEQKNVKGKPVKSATKRAPLSDQEVEPAEVTHPLLEPAEHRSGKVYLSGNKVLISLQLLSNRITEKGLKGFLAAMETQIQESKPIPGTRSQTGLLRLALGNNNFLPDNANFLRLQELMQARDPVHHLSRPSADEQGTGHSTGSREVLRDGKLQA